MFCNISGIAIIPPVAPPVEDQVRVATPLLAVADILQPKMSLGGGTDELVPKLAC